MYPGTESPKPDAGRVVTAVEHLDGSDREEVETSFSKPHGHMGGSGEATHARNVRAVANPEATQLNAAGSRERTGAREPPSSPSPPAQPADDGAAEEEAMGMGPSSAISAPDYADRQRLLFHITHLSTQLQRAQLQAQQQERTIAILHAAVAAGHAKDEAHAEGPHSITLPVSHPSTTAAVLAAQSEAELHAALSSALPLFDPVLAQSTIYRLDSALAQLSLLREAECERLDAAEQELAELRPARVALAARVDELTRRCAAAEEGKATLHARCEALQHEVEGLREEETRLMHRAIGLERLMADGTLMEGVRVVGAQGHTPRTGSEQRSTLASPLAALAAEEAIARQALLQEQFWGPMLIAFDAGLTWLAESALLSNKRQPQRDGDGRLVPDVPNELHRRSSSSGGAFAALPPPADADLLLMRSQQDEILALRSQLSVHQERLRMARLENDRLRFLYEGEQRRSEAMAADHTHQLERAYAELRADRTALAEQLRAEVEDQIRIAFRDGRRYERHRTARRSADSRSGAEGAAEAKQPVNGNGSGAAVSRPHSVGAREEAGRPQRPHHRQPQLIGPAGSSAGRVRQQQRQSLQERPQRSRPSQKRAPVPDRPTASADGQSANTSSASSLSSCEPQAVRAPHTLPERSVRR